MSKLASKKFVQSKMRAHRGIIFHFQLGQLPGRQDYVAIRTGPRFFEVTVADMRHTSKIMQLEAVL